MQYFYQPEIENDIHQLEDEEFQHCVKVLRNGIGDRIGIFDGRGGKYEVEITNITKRSCDFRVIQVEQITKKPFYNHIAIAPTKNSDRIEWFVEKACELGVDEISFILTKNCERTKMKTDRLIKKAVSALKQSKSGFLTKINELEKVELFVKSADADQKFIGYVADGLPYLPKEIKSASNSLILIGPEGDFAPEEVTLAETYGFQKISLGKSTLRTETAGLIAAHAVNVVNEW